MDLDEVSAGVFEKAIENVVFLRAQTGAGCLDYLLLQKV